MSYLETLRYAHLMNPFEQGTVEKAIELAKNDLLKQQIYVRKKQRNGGYFRFFAFFFATLYPKVPSFLPSRK